MKKLFFLLFAAALSFSTFSCRESTQEKTQDAADAVGNDIENTADEAGDQVQQEVNNTDDMEEVEDTTSVN
ncbi:MAG: hypothetical protein WCD31_14740 [Gillisia sp.]